MQSMHDTHTYDKITSQNLMNKIIQDYTDIITIRTSKDQVQRWLVNHGNARWIVNNLEVCLPDGTLVWCNGADKCTNTMMDGLDVLLGKW